MTDHSLTDLAAHTGVTPRTVRYYIAQGLLPAPADQGRSARYTDGHAARIRLIKRLQREHLPLAEIRNRLQVLDDAQVRRALQEDPATLPDQGTAAVRGASALEYIRRVLDEGSARGPGRPVRALHSFMPPPAAAPPPKPGIAPGSALRGTFERATPDEFPVRDHPDPDDLARRPAMPLSFPAPGVGPADRSTWERIGLTPDIELHVRRPLDRQSNRMLDRLIAYARELLSQR
jgi:DNA-binding transcriptional MerR regulator